MLKKLYMQNFDRNLLKICRLFYEDGLSKTEIANKFNISITHVNRLLKNAQKEGIVKIAINAPRHIKYELDLIEKLGLKDAKIVPNTEDEHFLRIDLGMAAAKYFEEKVIKGSRIGIGSGKTLYQMTEALQEESRDISIYSISSIAEKDPTIRSISSASLTSILWYKFRPDAEAYKINLFFPHKPYTEIERDILLFRNEKGIKKLWNDILDLDFYFFCVSHLREDSQILGILKDTGKTLNDLRKIGIIGDILFNTVNESGEYLPIGIENLIIAPTIDQLNLLAKNRNKNIVLVAGGKQKIRVIQGALRAQLCNVLITDDKTAKILLTSNNIKKNCR